MSANGTTHTEEHHHEPVSDGAHTGSHDDITTNTAQEPANSAPSTAAATATVTGSRTASDDSDAARTVRLRGLPFGSRDAEVREFFAGISIAAIRALPNTDKARPPTEALVTFTRGEDVSRALQRDRALIGRRYVEVFRVDAADLARASQSWMSFDDALRAMGGEDGFVVRLRGVPFDARVPDIQAFLAPAVVAVDAVALTVSRDGRTGGEACVRLPSATDVSVAMSKHKQRINARYIEVFPATLREFRERQEQALAHAQAQPTPQPQPPPGHGSRDPERDRGRDRVRERERDWDRDRGRARSPGADSRRDRDFDRRLHENFVSYLPRSHGREPVGPHGPLGLPFAVKLRGLPFASSGSDVVDFLRGTDVEAVHVLLDPDRQRLTGDAAAVTRHRSLIGRRYIEVYPCSTGELRDRLVQPFQAAPPYTAAPTATLPHGQVHALSVPPALAAAPVAAVPALASMVLRARGLPPSTVAREPDLIAFFTAGSAVPSALHRNETEAFVEFANDRDATAAFHEANRRKHIAGYAVDTQLAHYNEMAAIVGLPPRQAVANHYVAPAQHPQYATPHHAHAQPPQQPHYTMPPPVSYPPSYAAQLAPAPYQHPPPHHW